MTGKRRPIAVAFAIITATQLALGIYAIFLTATHPGGPWALSGSLAPILTRVPYLSQRRSSPQFRLTASSCAPSRATGELSLLLLECR